MPIISRKGSAPETSNELPVMASELDFFVSPHVILPALLCLVSYLPIPLERQTEPKAQTVVDRS